MTLEDILIYIIEKLEKEKIEYMITGSFASNLYGIPRTTFDADIVIFADFEKIENFLKEVEKDFYIDIGMAREAFDNEGIFNIIHLETGFKIDFIIKKKGVYYDQEFKRKRLYRLKNKTCYFPSPEDTILSKLIWAKQSDSERQWQDALGIAKVQEENLDKEYLIEQAKILNVSHLLEKIFKELEKE